MITGPSTALKINAIINDGERLQDLNDLKDYDIYWCQYLSKTPYTKLLDSDNPAIRDCYYKDIEGTEWVDNNLYATDENNIHEDSKYFYITKLAAECVSKRMMPDFISAKHMRQNYEGNVFGCMGCRAWLSPYKGDINNEDGKYKWYGRFNMGLTSINLADCGMSANGDINEFWNIFDDRLELCYESLMLRYEKLKDVTSDVKEG